MMKTKSGKKISKIGLGSYGIGGRGHRDMTITERLEDNIYIHAVAYALKKGVNFTEIALGYGHGQSLALFKKGFDESKLKREDIFITHSLYPRDFQNPETINQDIEGFYRIMGTDYADSTLISHSMIAKFDEKTVYGILQDLLNKQKTRFVTLSNASPAYIKRFRQEFKDKFIAHEGHLSFEIRALQDKGVFDLCKNLGITNIIWRPLRRNSTAKLNWPLLSELSKKYSKNQNQIILNWICHLNYYPMVMSANINHIGENLASLDFEMSDEDYTRMNNWRPENYHPPIIDWEKTGEGDSIVTLVNDFEKHIN